jgi:hypothetical protein
MEPNGVDKALADSGVLGVWFRAPKQEGSKICFGFFWTGFLSSERKQYSGSESGDMGAISLHIVGGSPTGYLSKW